MMTEQTSRPNTIDTAAMETAASLVSRYGLVLVIGWIGVLKFTEYEAQGIQPLVAHSPFMSWLYDFLPVGTFSALLGVFEVLAAVLIAVKPLAPRVSIAGSAMAVSRAPRSASCSPHPVWASPQAEDFRRCHRPASSC